MKAKIILLSLVFGAVLYIQLCVDIKSIVAPMSHTEEPVSSDIE